MATPSRPDPIEGKDDIINITIRNEAEKKNYRNRKKRINSEGKKLKRRTNITRSEKKKRR